MEPSTTSTTTVSTTISPMSSITSTSFGFVDYSLFVGFLVISMLIGLISVLKSKSTTDDFLLANRNLSPLPVAMSLMVSFISAVGLLGLSGEVYTHDLQLFLSYIGGLFGMFFVAMVTLPVFYTLKIVSINEYIELRFHSRYLRLLLMIIQTVHAFMYMGILLYAPTVAMATVTPIPQYIYIYVTGGVCILYSSIGGLRAVVWTDVFQFIVMLIGVLTLVFVGTYEAGGVEGVWRTAYEGGRTTIANFNLSIYERHNILGLLIMGFLSYAKIFGCTQETLQRICSVRSMQDSKRMMYWTMAGFLLLHVLIFISGLVVFAAYSRCDPTALGMIEKGEQILPFFVLHRLGFVYGLPGLFIATLVGGAMSSVSSTLNAVVAMIWRDLLFNFTIFATVSQTKASFINKTLSFVCGAVVIICAVMASNASSLVQLMFTVGGVMGAPIFGVFLLGLAVPHCTTKAVWGGLLCSWGLLIWLSLGAMFTSSTPPIGTFSAKNCSSYLHADFTEFTVSIDPSVIIFEKSPIISNQSIEYDVQSMSDVAAQENSYPLSYLYGISYIHYPLIGNVICMIIALFITLITGKQSLSDVNKDLITPLLRGFYWKKITTPEMPIEVRVLNGSGQSSSSNNTDS